MTAIAKKRKFSCATHHQGAAQRAASKKPCKDRTHHGRCAGWHAHRPAPPKWVCAPSCDTRHRRITAVRQRSVQPHLCMRTHRTHQFQLVHPCNRTTLFWPDAAHATEPLPFGVSRACLRSLQGRASTLPEGVGAKSRDCAATRSRQDRKTGPWTRNMVLNIDAVWARFVMARPFTTASQVSRSCTGPGMANLPVLHRWNLAYPVVCQGCTRQRRAFDVGPPGGRSR